jgi:hypothetical protein
MLKELKFSERVYISWYKTSVVRVG